MDIEQQGKRTVYSGEIEELLERERKARQNNQHHHSVTILQEIIQLVFDAKQYKDLKELLLTLSKKRGQPVKAQIEMVRLAMTFIDKFDDLDEKMAYVKCLKDVCEKKIYLEVEYARCCLMIVKNQETNENIEEAARILQNVQVETYGSMDAREKLEFILYQMKIMIKKNDYIRTLIVSRKIGKKSFDYENVEDLKIMFATYMHFYLHNEKKYLESSKQFRIVLDGLNSEKPSLSNLGTETEFGFKFDKELVFAQMIFYAAQSNHGEERTSILRSYAQDFSEQLDRHPNLKTLVTGILGKELISCDTAAYKASEYLLYSDADRLGAVHLAALKKMLIQHNLLVISTYYKRIFLSRCSQLFKVLVSSVETELCEMINEGFINGKIDRLEGIISFRKTRSDDDILDDWVTDVNKLLNLVDETCNLIHREEENFSN